MSTTGASSGSPYPAMDGAPPRSGGGGGGGGAMRSRESDDRKVDAASLR